VGQNRDVRLQFDNAEVRGENIRARPERQDIEETSATVFNQLIEDLQNFNPRPNTTGPPPYYLTPSCTEHDTGTL